MLRCAIYVDKKNIENVGGKLALRCESSFRKDLADIFAIDADSQEFLREAVASPEGKVEVMFNEEKGRFVQWTKQSSK